jgi:hypothetical protein
LTYYSWVLIPLSFLAAPVAENNAARLKGNERFKAEYVKGLVTER